MRKNLAAKSALYPQPVLVLGTYSEDGTPNAMTAAWGGVSGADEITLCIGIRHKTTENFKRTGAFTVSMAVASQLVPCDYVGLVSGKDVPDKFERAGFHAVKSDFVNAPLIEELPLTLECTVKSYDDESHQLIGKVVNVSADEKFLTSDGKIDLAKMQIITYDTCGHTYCLIGEKAGTAYEDGKKLF